MAAYILLDGNPKDVDVRTQGEPFTVAAYPGVGDTVAVSFSLGSGHWYPWDAGPVTGPTIRTVRSTVQMVRFQRTAGTSVTSIGEVL